MSKKKELENILKAEIVLAAKKLISATDNDSFDRIMERFDKLFSKLSAYKYLKNSGETGWEEFFAPSKETVNNDAGITASSVRENPGRELQSPEEGNPAGQQTDNPAEDKVQNPLKTHEEIFKKSVQTKFKPKHQTAPDFNIGLADKIALVKNLFDNNSGAFDEFIQRINKTKSYDEALGLVYLMKDKYDWTGKDEYEFRLLQLIQAKFS